MKHLMTAGVLASFGLAGCAAYGGAPLLTLPIDVAPSRNASVSTPDAIQTATGTRFHGSVCRRAPWNAPTRIRIERIGQDGTVVGVASRPISGLSGRGSRCAFYDVLTDWTIAARERVRVCAGRSDAPCQSATLPRS
jgi:hypothetical protein